MEGYSQDGYIIDQDLFTAYRYRTVQASRNSCGCIAAFNVRRALGQETDFQSVLTEMDDMHLFRCPGPTRIRVMREYLERYAPGFREALGRLDALEAAKESRMGVFRYREQGVPHYVFYLRQEDGLFRFFNVCNDLEDGCLPMDQFVREHCLGEPVRLLYWN